jgi:hypothetical protein
MSVRGAARRVDHFDCLLGFSPIPSPCPAWVPAPAPSQTDLQQLHAAALPLFHALDRALGAEISSRQRTRSLDAAASQRHSATAPSSQASHASHSPASSASQHTSVGITIYSSQAAVSSSPPTPLSTITTGFGLESQTQSVSSSPLAVQRMDRAATAFSRHDLQQLQLQPTQSWIYMPFIYSIFRVPLLPGERACISLVQAYWSETEPPFDECVAEIRRRYQLILGSPAFDAAQNA